MPPPEDRKVAILGREYVVRVVAAADGMPALELRIEGREQEPGEVERVLEELARRGTK